MFEVALAVLFNIPGCAEGDIVEVIRIVLVLPEFMLPNNIVHVSAVILLNVPPFNEYLGLINSLNHDSVNVSVNITLSAVSGPRFVTVTVYDIP